MPRRRAVLVGAGAGLAVVALGAGAVVEQVVPGRAGVRRALGLDGPAGRVPDDEPGRLVSGSFVSQARGGVHTGWAVSYPPGAPTDAALPVLVLLHGREQSHRTAFGRSHLGMDRFLAAYVAGGGAPFAVAAVDGGTSYWHQHAGHGDTGAMVLDELLPILAKRGLRTSAIGLTGLSMGGYGSLRLAGLLGASRCAVVAVESPALWVNAGDASRSGFADAAEYRRYSVFGHQAGLDGIPLRIGCGEDDPFLSATRAYVAGFAPGHQPTVRYAPGAHNLTYWRRVAPAQLAFAGRHLALD